MLQLILTMRVTLIVFVIIVGSAKGYTQRNMRIVGGSDTSIQHYPFMSNMELMWGVIWIQSCGGSLITSSTILSAAHCYSGYQPSQWRVRLGTSYRSTGGTIHTVSELIVHSGYLNLDNDLAIVRLTSPTVLSNSIKVARFAGPNYDLPDGAVVTSIGWGDLEYYGFPPEVLQEVDINVVNQELCAERYAYLKTQPGYQNWPDVTDNMLCAGILDVGGKDACQGDSGGPVVHQGDIIVGITSWGFECANDFYPGVNVRVSQYTNWIIANGSS